MFSQKIIPAVTLALFSLINASPVDISERSLAPVKRYNTVVNCDEDLPEKDPDNNLNTKRDLLGRALADMVTLANHGFNELFDRGKESLAFQHYFLPDDLDLVRSLFGGVAENNNPTNVPYEFIVDCKPVSQCSDKTYAITNPRPESGGPRTMTICPAFFSAPWANADHLLPSDPDNKDQQARWCESDEENANTMSYRKFVTPGHTLLHEITHLDKVGAFLENEKDNVGGHGTFDYITLDGKDPSEDDPGTDVLWQARQLQVLWAKDGKRDDTKDNAGQVVPPIRNAESFAGCGTESYFVQFCDVSWIAPKQGVGPDDEEEDPEDDPEWEPPS